MYQQCAILPEEMCSKNAILGECFLPNYKKVNSRCVTSQDGVRRTSFLNFTEYGLLNRNVFNDSLQEGEGGVGGESQALSDFFLTVKL